MVLECVREAERRIAGKQNMYVVSFRFSFSLIDRWLFTTLGLLGVNTFHCFFLSISFVVLSLLVAPIRVLIKSYG